jgi:hypothetical protein
MNIKRTREWSYFTNITCIGDHPLDQCLVTIIQFTADHPRSDLAGLMYVNETQLAIRKTERGSSGHAFTLSEPPLMRQLHECIVETVNQCPVLPVHSLVRRWGSLVATARDKGKLTAADLALDLVPLDPRRYLLNREKMQNYIDSANRDMLDRFTGDRAQTESYIRKLSDAGEHFVDYQELRLKVDKQLKAVAPVVTTAVVTPTEAGDSDPDDNIPLCNLQRRQAAVSSSCGPSDGCRGATGAVATADAPGAETASVPDCETTASASAVPSETAAPGSVRSRLTVARALKKRMFNDSVDQHLRIMCMSVESAEILRRCGHKIAFLDATNGINEVRHSVPTVCVCPVLTGQCFPLRVP